MNVDDIDMPIKEYADLMEVFEAGYAAKEKEIIDRWFEKMEVKKKIMYEDENTREEGFPIVYGG